LDDSDPFLGKNECLSALCIEVISCLRLRIMFSIPDRVTLACLLFYVLCKCLSKISAKSKKVKS
jgi:hypothetical protein